MGIVKQKKRNGYVQEFFMNTISFLQQNMIMKTVLLLFPLQVLVGSSFCLSTSTQASFVAPVEIKRKKLRSVEIAKFGLQRRTSVLQFAAPDREPPIGDSEELEYFPTSTFGAEAVPEDQRPANEYLDLIRQPLFGWADEQRGDRGLVIRLGLTYVLFFLGV
jgi:hypothetical protein